jgi:predicted TIM-barrel fold metal-dependent hydrolase
MDRAPGEGTFILDSLVHALNWDPSNYADYGPAEAGARAAAFTAAHTGSSEYDYPEDKFISDWSVDDIASLLFRESTTTVGVFNPQPLFIYRDGLTSLEKARYAIERYPTRFIGTYAAIDPLRPGWQDHLRQQVEELRPMGLKLYPASWQELGVETYQMSDPKIAFPVFELCLELGIRHVAVHKALPIGPIEYRGAFNPADFEGAAAHFPEIDFEMVHGGLAFVEETAWMMAKFPNIYINMENMNITAARRPRQLARIFLGLMHVAGNTVLDRIEYGTGTFQFHPRPCIEGFLDFEFPADMLGEAGLFMPCEQITMDNKLDILGRTFARRHGIDVDAVIAETRGDEFDRPAGEPLPRPYSTLSAGKALVR